MPGEYYCAFCEKGFRVEDANDHPACPTCGQTLSVKRTDTEPLIRDIRKQWFVVFALLLLLLLGYAVYPCSP